METQGTKDQYTERGLSWLLVALVVLVAILPSLGTLGAGLISEDGAALGYVHRVGGFADWFRPEYDLHTIRFWRPLVTVSLGIQESLTGVAALPLRLFNLLGHAAGALLAMQIARQLGARIAGAVLVGCLVGLFPYQGGTVTWIVGRVDSQCVPLALGAIAAALGGRSLLAGGLFFLALASKEVAIAVPFATASLFWARGSSLIEARRPILVMLLVFVLTISWRRLAIGTWVGGYPGGLSSSFPDGFGMLQLLAIVTAVWAPLAWLLGGLAITLVLGARWGGGLRLWIGAIFAGAFALAPLVRSFSDGPIPPEHQRILMLADALFCIAFTVLFVPRVPRLVTTTAWVLVFILIVKRGRAAWVDTHTWAKAGDMAAAYVDEVYDTLVSGTVAVEASNRPVLRAGFPRLFQGAYVLHWGVADRFRAPFPVTPRPVWPWRPVFDGPGMERDSVTWPEQNLRWPFDRGRRMVPPLVVRRAEVQHKGEVVSTLEVAAELLTEPGPQLVFEGSFPGARFEVLCFTELGFGVGLYDGPRQGGQVALAEDGSVSRPFDGTLSLREVMQLEPRGAGTGGTPLWQVLALAADFGASEAYLEFRAVDDARGISRRAVGASDWIHLTWNASLRDVIKPFERFE